MSTPSSAEQPAMAQTCAPIAVQKVKAAKLPQRIVEAPAAVGAKLVVKIPQASKRSRGRPKKTTPTRAYVRTKLLNGVDIDVFELAIVLGLHHQTVRKWAKIGRIVGPDITLAQHVRWTAALVIENFPRARDLVEHAP